MAIEAQPRRSRFAGAWYPAGREALKALVDRSFSEAPVVETKTRVVALVCPHAGLRYSGRIAAAAYRLVRGAPFDRVLVVGPYHRGGTTLSIGDVRDVETPLGVVSIDHEIVEALTELDPDLRSAALDIEREHSIEIQFPWLQRALPGALVAPLFMGSSSDDTLSRATAAIVHAVSRAPGNVLLVASSDLSHFHDRAEASRLDAVLLAELERADPRALRRRLRDNPGHACGGGPIVSVLEAALSLGASRVRIVAYGDSGEASGDLSSVVGYGAAAIV